MIRNEAEYQEAVGRLREEAARLKEEETNLREMGLSKPEILGEPADEATLGTRP